MTKVNHRAPQHAPAQHTRSAPPPPPPRAPAPAARAPAPPQRPAARNTADHFEPARPANASRVQAPAQRPATHAAHETRPAQPKESAKARSQRYAQVSRTIEREIDRLPMPAEDRKKLEQAALHPGKSAEDRRTARDLRRVVYSTRSMPRSAQENLVKPFADHPHGAQAHAAARLTRDLNFRKASNSEKELMASVFPSTGPSTARGLPAAARQLTQAKLPEAQREQILRHGFSHKSDPDVRLATRDVLRALKGQPEAAQKALLKPFSQPHISEQRATYARDLVHSPAWKGLGPTERTQLAQVFSATGAELRSLQQLSQQPARLMDQDARGGTLLSNLAQLAQGPLHAAIPESRRGELLRGVLMETAQASQVNQDRFNTCTVTSMEYELARDNPGEYARLVAGLAGPTGRVEMRGGGELELQADSLIPDASGDPLSGERSLSEAMFQTALMEYGNGTEEYLVQGAKSDESVRPDGSTHIGLSAEGMVRASSALFGRQFSTWGTDSTSREAQLNFLRNYQPEGPNAPALMSYFPDWPSTDTGHAVDFVRVEGDRVFFRNPWGPSGLKPGDTQTDGSRMEDPSQGLYSFSLDQFRERVYMLTVPEEARAFGAPAAAA